MPIQPKFSEHRSLNHLRVGFGLGVARSHIVLELLSFNDHTLDATAVYSANQNVSAHYLVSTEAKPERYAMPIGSCSSARSRQRRSLKYGASVEFGMRSWDIAF